MRIAVRLAAIGLALAAYFVRLPAGWVERVYSRGLYATVQPALTGLSNRVPFALFDVLLAAALVLLVAACVSVAGRVRREGARSIGIFLLSLAAVAAIVYLAFLVLWGFNYRREPLSARLVLSSQPPSRDAVAKLEMEAVRQMNALHGRARKEGFAAWDELRPTLEKPFERVQGWLAPGARPRSGVPKASLLSYYFDRSGVSGMTDPFFLEVLVDRDLLPFERPFVLAHEWAHLAGFADEAEANFVGWLTCVNGEAPAAYSGWMYLFAQALASFPRAERAQYVRALASGPREDLTALAERARRIHPVLQSVSWRVYDRYLKANRVGEGIASYDRALLLVLGSTFEKGWLPAVKK